MSDLSGVFPPNYDTPVGKFRLLTGDVNGECGPERDGTGVYSTWSDAEIAAFISLSPDNIYRAISEAYRALAGNAAENAKYVKDYDLQLDTRKRSDELLRISLSWSDRADELDAELTLEEGFGIYDTVNSTCCDFLAESSPHPFCRGGCR